MMKTWLKAGLLPTLALASAASLPGPYIDGRLVAPAFVELAGTETQITDIKAYARAKGWTVDCERPPRLVDAQASLLCRRIDHHRFGTHSIFIGQVEEVTVRDEVAPLVYLDGSYAGAG